MVEKWLEMQGRMAVGFVDMEKAYDTVPREMVMAIVRWMGVPEAEARMVEAMYERTKRRVVVGSGLSEEFPVNIGLRQGSALSPLLFIMVMKIISRKISTKDILRKMMYAYDLAILAESKQDQQVLDEWKGVFEKHGLRMSLEKTEVMWVGQQREELNIRLDGKEIKQVDGFVYLGGKVTEDGHSAAEVRRRTQAGANAWRKIGASHYWLRKGCPKNKLVIGLAGYGRTFTLTSPAAYRLNAPAKYPGEEGTYTREKGMMSYYEVCKFLGGGATEVWDPVIQAPYAFKNNQWVGYDNPRSLKIKGAWLATQKFAGYMFWTPDLEDFTGKYCNTGKFPLQQAIIQGMTHSHLYFSGEGGSGKTTVQPETLHIPAEVPQTPAEISHAPTGVVQVTAEVPHVPAEVPQAPVEVPQPPVEVPQVPAEVPQAPVEVPQPPVEVPQAPAELPQPPVEVPQPPVEVPQAPAEVPQAPAEVPAAGGARAGLKRVCYYTNWAQYRPEGAKFFPKNVDFTLCTHVIYAFAVIDTNHLKPYEWNDESSAWATGMYQKVTSLKKLDPSIKVLLAVGGWNFGTKVMAQMLSTAANRAEFVRTSVQFLHRRSFDGLDLDFEYPASRGSPAGDKHRFTLLVRELRAAFKADSVTNGRRLLLTAAVAAGKSNIDRAYEVPAIASQLDWIGVMTYDLHGFWDGKTGHHSALYAPAGSSAKDRMLTIIGASNYWLRKGCPKNKLVIGLAAYGRVLTLDHFTSHGLNAPAARPGIRYTYTRELGMMSYYEVCRFLAGGGTKVWDPVLKAPYAYKGNQWVGYDDPRSLKIKGAWLAKERFGGYLFWALDLDDFEGKFCNQGKNPLQRAIIDGIEHGAGVEVITPGTGKPEQEMTQVVDEPNTGVVTGPADGTVTIPSPVASVGGVPDEKVDVGAGGVAGVGGAGGAGGVNLSGSTGGAGAVAGAGSTGGPEAAGAGNAGRPEEAGAGSAGGAEAAGVGSAGGPEAAGAGNSGGAEAGSVGGADAAGAGSAGGTEAAGTGSAGGAETAGAGSAGGAEVAGAGRAGGAEAVSVGGADAAGAGSAGGTEAAGAGSAGGTEASGAGSAGGAEAAGAGSAGGAEAAGAGSAGGAEAVSVGGADAAGAGSAGGTEAAGQEVPEEQKQQEQEVPEEQKQQEQEGPEEQK
ncbi:hypothetical protein LSAT2_022121 [Lamellibrachia satsuma]|nr:hypothetical protein LSAT2_022121 [Lamellibrachia satsuma]